MCTKNMPMKVVKIIIKFRQNHTQKRLTWWSITTVAYRAQIAMPSWLWKHMLKYNYSHLY